ncbi:MAG: serine/threonine protein kinase [Burkholderiales bacterium]|nr:serine/threonine protein kinase [Burkholderiales bacterium]
MSVYQALTPELILDAVESASGLRCDGRLQALNSYENRVYQLWLDDGGPADAIPVVAKFYRPQRWSSAAIQEEQDFATELAARELPVVAPLAFNGRTLHEHGGFQFALTPRRGGRTPELDDPETLQWMGRFIARIHAVGQVKPFTQRPTLDIESFAYEPVQFVLDGDFVPDDLYDTYASVAEDVVERIERRWEAAGAARQIRLHGDCHAGNVLWTDDGPHFVDLDDARMGPAVQDLWMCLSGERKAQQAQLLRLLEGYCEFREFDANELMLVEALRTLRMVHYAGWLARRWDDPAFPASFPFFNTQRYWQDHILALREQSAVLDEPPLQWRG